MSIQEAVFRPHGALITKRDQELDFLSVTHRSYDQLSCVMLFPHGKNGRQSRPSFRTESDACKETSSHTLYATWLFERRLEFSALLRADCLFQKYLVDE